MSKPAYHRWLSKQDNREIVKCLVPDFIFRLRRRFIYRNRYPQSFICSRSIVDRGVSLGKNCIVRQSALTGQIEIGNYTTIGALSTFSGSGSVNVGKFCSIGPECFIRSENHNLAYATTYPLEQVIKGQQQRWNEYQSGKISIGNDVWIGSRVSILSGAKIGDGCVVAAGTVISAGDIPPYSIVGGVPAKVIKMRFDADTIEWLRKLAWWERPEQDIFGQLLEFLHDGYTKVDLKSMQPEDL